MRVLATYSIKGGVGKTSTAVNLAYLSAMGGARTLLWDLDPQGASTFYFRIKAKRRGGAKGLIRGERDIDSHIRGTDYEDLDVLRAYFAYRNMDMVLAESKKPAKQLGRTIAPLAEDYDCLFFDCAPSISLVSENVFAAADALLVPTIPTPLAMRTLEQLIAHLDREGFKRLRILPFFCMVDRRKKLHREICEHPDNREKGFLNTYIPYASVIEKMGIHRAPVLVYAQNDVAAFAYRALWSEVQTRLATRIIEVRSFPEAVRHQDDAKEDPGDTLEDPGNAIGDPQNP